MSTDYGQSPYSEILPDVGKTPAEVVDFIRNWVADLDGETITASAWDGNGLTVDSSTYTDYSTTVRLSGGVDGIVYEAENTVTTSTDQTYVRTLKVKVSGENVTQASESDGLDLEGAQFDLLLEDGNRLLLE